MSKKPIILPPLPPESDVTVTASGVDPPYKPPSLLVRWEDGSCGDAIREAQDLLRAEVESVGQRVTGWDIGGVELDKERGDPKTPGHSKRLIGYEEGNINKPVVASVTHVRRLVTPKVDLEAKLEERWLRLTSASGPCAVEMLTTRGGQVVDRAKLHPEDMRDISVRKAERALQEFGG